MLLDWEKHTLKSLPQTIKEEITKSFIYKNCMCPIYKTVYIYICIYTYMYRHTYLCIYTCMSFPGGSDGKASAYNAGDPGSIPGSGRSPGEGNGNPLQYSCLENPMVEGTW